MEQKRNTQKLHTNQSYFYGNKAQQDKGYQIGQEDSMTDIENEESVPVRLHKLSEAITILEYEIDELTGRIDKLEREIRELKERW